MLYKIAGIFIALGAISNYSYSGTLNLSNSCVLKDKDSVGPNFKGHSTYNIFNIISKTRPKDKFDTEEEFESRLKETIDKKIGAANSKLCAIGEIIYLRPKYNLESKIMSFSPYLFRKEKVNGETILISTVYGGERNRKESEYIGSNAFGASINVAKTKRDIYLVAFPPDEFTKKTENIEIKIEPEEARKLEERFHSVIQYEIASPGFSVEVDTELPTFRKRYHYETKEHLVIAKILAISVIDTKTGKIYKTMTREDTLQE